MRGWLHALGWAGPELWQPQSQQYDLILKAKP